MLVPDDISGPQKMLGESEIFSPLLADQVKGSLQKFLQCMTAACGDYVVGRSGLIQHRRNRLNILWRPPPIPLDSEIAERETHIAPRGQRGHPIHTLPGNQPLGPPK